MRGGFVADPLAGSGSGAFASTTTVTPSVDGTTDTPRSVNGTRLAACSGDAALAVTKYPSAISRIAARPRLTPNPAPGCSSGIEL